MNDNRQHQPSRRGLLKGAVGALGVSVLPFGRILAQSPAVPEDMIGRAIPATGERVPISGLGTARTFDVDPDDPGAMAKRQAVLQAFFEGGGRVADTSPMYGHAETVLGRAASALEITGELFFATKVWTRGAEAGREQMRQSMERLGTETVDLMQVHNLLDLRTHLDTLRAWKAEGRIRYLGVTHYTASHHDELAKLVETEALDFVQFNYNLAARNAEKRLLPACADNGVATLINEPFEKGTLFGRVSEAPLPDVAEALGCTSWAQLFLKYIFGHPAVTCAIPATSDPEHAAENVAAGRGPAPDADQRRRILAAFESA